MKGLRLELPRVPGRHDGRGLRAPGVNGHHKPTSPARIAGEGPDILRVVQDDLQRELGRLEGRLELTAQAESTAREDLERERARVEEERRRADAERERVEELRRVLEAERSRGFWGRLLGG